MYRLAIKKLFRWKEKPNRKPLIIEGARQVGKTWLMKEFGEKAYNKTIYINFDSNTTMSDLFSYDLDINRLITGKNYIVVRKLIQIIHFLYLMKFKKFRKHYLL